jgi:hypothetical protein
MKKSVMKFALPLFAVCVVLLSAVAEARPRYPVRGFGQSNALSIVLDTIYDASFDFEGMYLISHNIDFLGDKKTCTTVSVQVILRHFKKIFDEFISYYPDEELPYDQALKDLKKIVGNGKYQRCHEVSTTSRGHVDVTHYQSLDSELWIRIEYNVLN